MVKFTRFLHFVLVIIFSVSAFAQGDNPHILNPIDVFDIEYGSSPQMSPDGETIVYVRNSMDIMTDRTITNLWLLSFDGSYHRPLTTGNNNFFSPKWSPDGSRLLYLSNADRGVQMYIRWMDSGESAKITNFVRSPGSISWSPDGNWIAFTMFVPADKKPFAKMPSKPAGAKWNDPPRVIERVRYRADGAGFLREGYRQIFIVPAEGGSPRQLTSGNLNHGGPLAWMPDGKSIVFSANLHENWEYEPNNSDIHILSIEDGSIKRLTDRFGPDRSPVISPDGRKIAYTGYDDTYQGYTVGALYVMNSDGSGSKMVTKDLDRDVNGQTWSDDGKGLYFQYDTEGNTRIAYVSLDGEVRDLAENVGGLSLGRPYGGGQFDMGPDGRFAFTHSLPDHPAEIAVGKDGSKKVSILTDLNKDVFGHKELGPVEEIWYKSSFDGRDIQGWIAKPPGFDPSKKYPLILEIHGGPFSNYGNRFSAEVQLFASAGYVVLYTNPRGSTSYGGEFGNLIHHNYPSEDYDDLISGVDAVISKGYIDEEKLFVTGGSGGGVLTAWIVGKTDRFAAAVVAKPVINWYTFVLTADNPVFFSKYWFPGFPWDNLEHYMKRSPLTYAGNVVTPTMLLTGESDYRTPMTETEQFYQALKLRKVDTAMVRIPNASHGIASKPSNLIAKVTYILEWFERYSK